MRHTLREMWSGLRRNVSMTVAVVITMWVSLTLLGASLMTMQQVDLVKGRWYDKIEVSVFLCVPDMPGGTCEPGQATTDAQRSEIERQLKANPEVQSITYVSQEQAYEEFQKTYADEPGMLGTLTKEQMQDSFRVKLVNPENYESVVQQARALPGVQSAQDLNSVLDPVFSWLNALKWSTAAMAGLLLLAAALQIGNTIRMTAYSRRREIGIMRLVGASNLYILLPFLLEALFAALVGIMLAGGTMALAEEFLVKRRAEPLIKTLDWIGWNHTLIAIGGVAIVGIVLSIIPTLLATRKYLRV